MEKQTKQIIAFAVLAVMAWVAYYGTFLPLQKSQLFIRALGRAGSVKDLNELQGVFQEAISNPSPVGQEELARSMTNNFLGLIDRSGKDAELTKNILSYVDSYYRPIIERGRGMSFGQDLYVLAQLHKVAYMRTGDPKYLGIAKGYLSEGLMLSPTRPQFLYDLFGVALQEGNAIEAKKLGEQIISQWPTDSRIKGYLDEIEKSLTTKK